MPLSTRDEILFTYASLIQPEFIKTAWGWNDLVTTFGLDAVGLGVGAGIGAAEGTGALVGAISVGSGGTVPMAIGAALLIGGLGYGIYNLYKLTDDNIASLISRLGALDGNQKAQPYIDTLIKDLEAFKRSLDGLALVTGTDEEKAQKLVSQLKLIGEVVEYLKTKLQREWSGIKENLTDWGRDPAEAEVAINKTIPAIEAEYKKLAQQLQENTKKVIQDYSQKSGQNYINISNEIVGLYNKVTSLNGNKSPIFDPAEDSAWTLVQKILGKDEDETVTSDELNQGTQSLLTLKTSLQQALDYLSKKTPARASVNKPPISKRALTLADGKHFGPVVNMGPGGKRISSRNPAVESIQKLINGFRKYIPDRDVLSIDGIFGPMSAASLNALMVKIPQLEEYMNTYVGVTGGDVFNYKELNQNQEKLDGINKALLYIYKSIIGKAPWEEKEEAAKPQKQQKEKREPVGQCPWGKDDMDVNEIESCLRAITVQEEGRERMDASTWLDIYNYSTPEDRAKLVRDQLGSKGDWVDSVQSQLVWDVKKMHPTQPGTGQFGFSET